MIECCMPAKKPRKGAIHFLKDIFRDTTQQKENAFYTLLPEGKNNTGQKNVYSPGGAALYLYSNRAVRAQRTFLWEAPEIRADVFCVLHCLK